MQQSWLSCSVSCGGVHVGLLWVTASGFWGPSSSYCTIAQRCQDSEPLEKQIDFLYNGFTVGNPSAHRSLIAFAAWSSFAHAVVNLCTADRAEPPKNPGRSLPQIGSRLYSISNGIHFNWREYR